MPKAKQLVDSITPDAIVRLYPDPTDVIRQYVESDFARHLALEHDRTVAQITAEGATVTDADSLARVEARLVDVVRQRKAIEAWFAPIRDFAYKLHRMICDRQDHVLQPLNAFERQAKGEAQAFRRAEERRRQEEERRLEEEARRQEQERIAAEAAAIEARGDPELAQIVLEQAVTVAPPVVRLPDPLPAARGISYAADWRWRPLGGDTPEHRARTLKLIPREFLMLNERALTAYARTHGASGKIPGIEFFDAGRVAVRTS